MCSVQLSLFSDNFPDKELSEIKKKRNTGNLPKDPETSEYSQINNNLVKNEISNINEESVHINIEEILPTDNIVIPEPENIQKNNSPEHSEIDETQDKIDFYDESEIDDKISENIENEPEGLGSEDTLLWKIESEIKKKLVLTDSDRLNFLEQVKEVSLSCKKCRLSEKRTNVVFGVGNPNSLIMIIGEGPGEQEDLSGIPFVGRAGQLLDKILGSANFIRERDFYIVNVVKCRPPENRTPLPDESQACSVFLEKQMELSKAKIILLTGATAMKAILNTTSSISKVRGEWIEWKGKWVMPVFHPSYLLRNQSKEVGSPKWLMWQDIKKVRQKFDEFKEIN